MKFRLLDSSYRMDEDKLHFHQLCTGWTKSYVLDSSYGMDEDKLSFCVASYRMDEVSPASFLVPDGRGQAFLSCGFEPEGHSPANLIPRTGWKMTSSPFIRLYTGRTKSRLLDSLYQTDEDKLYFHVTSC